VLLVYPWSPTRLTLFEKRQGARPEALHSAAEKKLVLLLDVEVVMMLALVRPRWQSPFVSLS
jgi:hypothetical protein